MDARLPRQTSLADGFWNTRPYDYEGVGVGGLVGGDGSAGGGGGGGGGGCYNIDSYPAYGMIRLEFVNELQWK